MTIKLYIILTALSIAIFTISCNTQTGETEKHDEHDLHHEHGESGIVRLNENQQRALGIKTGSFQMRNLTTAVKANGQLNISPADKAEVSAVIGGNVKSIKVFVGDKVKKGQVLAVLEHPDYIKLQEDFAVSANESEFLKQEYERQKKLFENDITAQKKYQKAKTAYNIAKAKYEGLKSRLLLLKLSPEKVKNGQISNTIPILSPVSGSVNRVNVKLGTFADAKDIMFEIADNSKIHADFTVYEKDIHLLEKGQIVHFTVSNHPDKEFTARLFAIGTAFDSDTHSVLVHADIEGDTKNLIPGMYISGHLHTDKHYVRTLPDDAIVKDGTKSYIFITEEKHKNHEHEAHETHNHETENEHAHEPDEHTIAYKMTEVITGNSDEGFTQVSLIDSLPEGSKIVLNAAYYLLADMKKEETEHKH